MLHCDLIIRNAQVLDGSGAAPVRADVALRTGEIAQVGPTLPWRATAEWDAGGLTLCPGFIDVHTHDDTSVIAAPAMLPKLSQGVTTVIVGNCGISAAPVRLSGELPDPMNLLGAADAFRYPSFCDYVVALAEARPSVNVAALVGHTSLRSNHMDRLDRMATRAEIEAMRRELEHALANGALGLSTGLAYASANAADTQEVIALAAPLGEAGAVYSTHLRSEADAILEAMAEAFAIGQASGAPVMLSHLKCAGLANWGRSDEVLRSLEKARTHHPVACDCYPYAAGSSTLDLRQVDERVPITITWSTPYPALAGKSLAEIAALWRVPQLEAARRLQPAGAIYHSIAESDMRRILAHPATMVGSDGLPHDPRPHPRLWGAFPRVLGHYCREQQLFTLPEAVRKMTGLPAESYGLRNRGLLRKGYAADLVLFDAETIIDRATYSDPAQPCNGIAAVWVNGVLSYRDSEATGLRAGEFLPCTGSIHTAHLRSSL